MKLPVSENLSALAARLPHPLYLVGGTVRDFLAGFSTPDMPDYDISSPAPEDELISAAEACGFAVKSVFRHTGTVKLIDRDGTGYEFTRFRSDRYVRGLHAPEEIEFTDDIRRDARRRDFRANAVYYEIKTEEFCDPLGGIADIKEKKLRTVAPAEKVFGEDGLRLMRLARIAAETGFSPDGECLAGARQNRALVKDIAPERIFSELNRLLLADGKHGDEAAPYRGLCILRETGVLKEILPELALGDGMEQRAAFHDHDVLEHSFRCVKYAPPEVRFAALLHDAGKPRCFLDNGNFYGHEQIGAEIASEILTRLKAPVKLAEETAELVRLHMRDFDLNMREGKVRRELVACHPLLSKLFALKQADYSACKDDLSPAPSVLRWKAILKKMKAEGAPLTLRELAVSGDDLKAVGVPPKQIGSLLRELLLECAQNGSLNEKNHLLRRAKRAKEE